MDEIIKQQGNTILILDKLTGDILNTIGAQFFSFEFNAGSVQLVDSSRTNEIHTVMLANLYDEGLVNLTTEVLALGVLTAFNTTI